MDQTTLNQHQNTIVPTELLRDKIRQYLKSHRERCRANAEDSVRFGLGEIKTFIEQLDDLTEKDVIGLANRIKKRKHARPEDMYRLSHAFLQGLPNIEAFNKITGALQIIIKEFTGKNTECQIRAAECLCNLSLGEAPVCDKIASMAGSYLVTYLHSTEIELVRLCIWTITNVLATTSNDINRCKGFNILMKMELLPQLWKLYTKENGICEPSLDYREDVAICIQVIATNPTLHMQPEYTKFFLEHANEKKAPLPPAFSATNIIQMNSDGSEYHLQIIFHALFNNEDNVRNFSQSFMLYLINYSLNTIYVANIPPLPPSCAAPSTSLLSLSMLKELNMKENIKILYAIRTLSNLLALHETNYIITLLQEQLKLIWHSDLLLLFNKLFSYKNDTLTYETLWFLKTLLTKMAAQENLTLIGNENNISINNILDKLCISYENK